MSEVVPEPPAPPPPPPPPPSRPAGSIDFVRPLAFVFEDPRWLSKVLMGGVFVLASAILIGIPFLAGYLAKLARNVVDGVEPALPEWDDLAEFFSEGLSLICAAAIYVIPLMIVALVLLVPAGMLSEVDGDFSRPIGGIATTCVTCLLFPLSLAVGLWLPAAMLMAVVDRRFAAAFDFGRISTFIQENLGNYLIAIIIWLVARIAASIAGFLLLCIGLLFTNFWAMAVGAYAFAQVYRLAKTK